MLCKNAQICSTKVMKKSIRLTPTIFRCEIYQDPRILNLRENNCQLKLYIFLKTKKLKQN